MSTFAVTVNRIEKAWAHPNADRLSLASVEGFAYQFCTGKDEYKPGDTVLFFPPDAVLPVEIIAKMGLTGKLSGKDKNRIKTVTLRGQISQGIVARPELFFTDDRWKTMSADEVTAALGVTKYDPPPIPCHAGNLVMIPDGIGVYDIEGADRYLKVVEALMDQKVFISEKLEGTNYWISEFEGVVSIGQHHNRIEPIEGFEHDFFRVSRLQGLTELIKQIAVPGKRVTLRGELCGPKIQDNIYGLKDISVFPFDIRVNHEYMGPEEFLSVCEKHLLRTVPVLSIGITLREWLAGRTMQEASNGQSVLAPRVAREGFVVKPLVEQLSPEIGRLLIKQRSPVYLAGTDR